MNVNINQLNKLRSQRFPPQPADPSVTPYHEYETKEFGGQYLSELFHENTKTTNKHYFHVGQSVSSFVNNDSLAYATAQINPDYPGKPFVEMPEPEPLDCSIGDALASRRSVREYSGEGVSKSEMATLLAHSVGNTGEQTIGTDETGSAVTQSFRAYPSGGGLYPVEFYLVVLRGKGELTSGCYYYPPKTHGLRVLKRGGEEFRNRVIDLFTDDDIAELDRAGAIVFMTGAFWRARAKYGDRGYRQTLIELGYAGQNLYLTATAMGLGAVHFDGIRDRSVETFLDVNGVDESVLGSMVLGHPVEVSG